MRRRIPEMPPASRGPGGAPGPFVLTEWLPGVGDAVDPDLRRVYARRLWDGAWAAWGRRNGYDPSALYSTDEGRRWWEFRNGGPIRLLPAARSQADTGPP